MAKCYLYDIVDPAPEALAEEVWTQLVHRMRSSEWFGTEGKRSGFINVIRHRGMIGGYFANEGTRTGVQYDDNKEQIEPEPFYSFEHLFFVLFEDRAQLLLQSRNIYGYRDLSLPEMRNSFLDLLADLFRLLNVYVVGDTVTLERADITYTQEQLYSFFVTMAQVMGLEVSDLHGAAIPSPDDPRYQLFNPKDEWHEITWGAIADTLKSGLDHVNMLSVETPESTLQAPIPRALASVGEIERVTGYDQNGKFVYRERTEEAELEIELPLAPEMAPEVLDRVFTRLEERGRLESWEERMRRRQEQASRGTLFEDEDQEP